VARDQQKIVNKTLQPVGESNPCYQDENLTS
jgi:hypothetical protein